MWGKSKKTSFWAKTRKGKKVKMTFYANR